MSRRGAIVSDCGSYRYLLWRQWDDKAPLLAFCMLNLSTADGESDDATIRRGIGFGRTLGFGGIAVVNLFAYRTPCPVELRRAGWPVGAENDRWIEDTAQQVRESRGAFCCAWGANAARLARPLEILRILRRVGVEPQCLETTRGGHPSHPLYLPRTTHLRRLQGPQAS